MICFPWILIIVLQTVVSNQIPKLLIKVSHKDIYLVTCCLIQLITAMCFYADDIIVYANQLQ